MDISFTITNAINQTGTIDILYEEATVDTTLWKRDESGGDDVGLSAAEDT